MKHVHHKSQLLMMILVVGFFIGISYENIAIAKGLETMNLFQGDQLLLLQQMNVKTSKYMLHILKLRLYPLLGMLCLWNFRWKKVVVITGMAWIALVLGRIITGCIAIYGMKGLILCVAGLLPHFVFYVLAYRILIMYLISEIKRKWKKSNTAGFLAIFLIGLLLEVYVNPALVKYVLKWF